MDHDEAISMLAENIDGVGQSRAEQIVDLLLGEVDFEGTDTDALDALLAEAQDHLHAMDVRRAGARSHRDQALDRLDTVRDTF